jgi:drug/metabolite transporter (DMT)-like permease
MEAEQTSKKQGLDFFAMAILVVLCASWGLQQVAIKVTNPAVPPLLQAGIRSAGSAALLWAWMRLRREPFLKRDETLGWGIAAGVLFAGEFLLIYWGLEFTSASRAVVFLYTSPFVVALGAKIFIPGERLRLIQALGLCCAFAGIVVAFSESLSHPSWRMLIGDGMLAGAALLWGATTVMIRATPLASIPAAKTLLYQLLVSALVLPLGSLFKGEGGIGLLSPLILSSLAYQIIWVAFLTYLTWFWLLRRYPPSQLASFTFLTPLFGVMAGGLLLNEPLTRMLMLALALVASGIFLVNRPAAA